MSDFQTPWFHCVVESLTHADAHHCKKNKKQQRHQKIQRNSRM